MGDFPCPACCFLFQYQSPRALDLHGFQGPGASSYRAAPSRGAGLGPAQGGPCGVGSRPVPGGGAVGYCVPFGWSGLFRCLGAQRPGGPACPAGVPISPEKWGERGPGPSVIGRWSRWDRRRVDPARWVPARSRAGIQAFSRESPDAKSRGGGPPPPLFLWPARSHSLVLAVVAHCSGSGASTVPMYVP